MAASSKPTAVHYWLIAFVVLTLIFGAWTFMLNKSNNEQAIALAEAQKKANENQTASNRALEQIALLKKLIGYEFETVGTPEEQNQNTVAGAMVADIALAGQPAQPTYSAAIRKLADDLRAMSAERDQLRADLDKEHAALLALQAQYNTGVAEQTKGRNQAEQDLQARIRTASEELAQKDKDIETLRTAYNELQLENDNLISTHEKQVKDFDQQIKNLLAKNDQLRDRILEMGRQSYDVADGQILEVNHETRTVWINLGEEDKLPRRLTFSVYGRDSTGVGRSAEDIKAKIEVINILGSHMAEAKILEDDIFNPIGQGDAIFTPLWSPGRPSTFAFFGKLDVDRDGVSDRELVHQLIREAGGKIDSDVNETGERTGPGIDVNTKFLVMGDVPELPATPSEEERRIYDDMVAHKSEMLQEARTSGVEVINLDEFLDYIGYKHQTRVFRPGEPRPYTLKSGARSAAVRETLGNRSSTGNVSGLYSGNRAKIRGSQDLSRKLYRRTGGATRDY